MNIKLEHVNYVYYEGTTAEKKAVDDVTLEINDGEFSALVGSTGSGKSTLVQLMNGLKQPTSGRITYDGVHIGSDKKELRKLRCRVGLVFQYPEYQLFDETVLKDVAFGPKNKGLSAEEAEQKAREALAKVGLREELYQNSPFDLSGGEKRRAAIAGILAMEPDVLILDEPTAGLDPAGKIAMLDLIRQYHDEYFTTVIMVSHNMDEVAEYADRVIVMANGSVLMDGDKYSIFSRKTELEQAGLEIPQAAEVCSRLGIRGPVTIKEAVEAIAEHYKS